MPSINTRLNTFEDVHFGLTISSTVVKNESLNVFDLFEEDDIDVLGLADSGLESIDMDKSFKAERSFMYDTMDESSMESVVQPMDVPSMMVSSSSVMASHQEETEEEEQQGQLVNEETEILEKPKRSLTAYNLFFQDERKRLLKVLPVQEGKKSNRKVHGKLSFTEMARTVAANWKKITPEEKMEYEYRSELDKERFEKEYAIWKRSQSTGNLASKCAPAKNNNTNEMRGFSSEPAIRQPVPAYQMSNSNFQWQEYQEQSINAARNMFFS